MEELINRYHDDPVLFVKEVIGAEPAIEQKQMLESIRDNRMTAVKAGHGVGKTTTLAWAILWFLTTRPYPKIPCTAPTMHQLKDILWAEIAKWLNQSAILRTLFDWTAERVALKNYADNWFAVARTATKPDAMQGFHSDSLLFVLDEASGINDQIIEPILGALTGEETRLIMVGNPTKITGFFHDAFTVNRAKFGCITLNAENSKMVSRDFVQSIIDLYGKGSDPYRVRVLGEFPKAQADTFIPLDLVEKASNTNIAGTVYDIHIGCDVARYGDDESTVYILFQTPKGYKLNKFIVKYKNSTVELSGTIRAEIRRLNSEFPDITVNVNIDGGGFGSGVVDELEGDQKDLKYIVNEKTFGGNGGQLNEEPMLYTNDTGLLWGNVKRLLMADMLEFPEDAELTAQLTTRKYTVDEDGKIKLERKIDMKKRGLKSPDRADGLALALSTNINESIGMANY